MGLRRFLVPPQSRCLAQSRSTKSFSCYSQLPRSKKYTLGRTQGRLWRSFDKSNRIFLYPFFLASGKNNWSYDFTIKPLPPGKRTKHTKSPPQNENSPWMKLSKFQKKKVTPKKNTKNGRNLSGRLRIFFFGKIGMLHKVDPIMFSSPSSQRIPWVHEGPSRGVQMGQLVGCWFTKSYMDGWSVGDPKMACKTLVRCELGWNFTVMIATIVK